MRLNFYLIILYGYVVMALLLGYVFNRDRRNPQTFLGKRPWLAMALLAGVAGSIVLVGYVRFIEPNWLRGHSETIKIQGLKKPLRVAVVADLHVGDYKNEAWIQKVTDTIIKLQPDLVILAGDYTVNDGNPGDESAHLTPLKQLVGKFPIYAIMGNHEYGYVGYGVPLNYDKSDFIRGRFAGFKIPLLVNQLVCPTLQKQTICLFGNDDIYRQQLDFSDLKAWDQTTPLIQISHNPDGILFWPSEFKKPNLEIAAHTHGGQLWLPFIGPLGIVDVRLGTGFYRWLNYWNTIPIFTTVGTSESGAPLRLLTPPEVALLTLIP